jgi:tetratricopeptide (TPR) repeat protein
VVAAKVDLVRLQRSFDWALAHSVCDRELVLMLRPLVRATGAETPQGRAARLHLAERVLRTKPNTRSAWEAAILSRSVLEHARQADEHARAWGALGLAYTLLGQLRAAQSAYRLALRWDPSEPVTAHNLGHLEVVHLGRLASGLRWLEMAHRALPSDPEISASLAHALVRNGQLARARRVLSAVFAEPHEAESWLTQWTVGSSPNVQSPSRGANSGEEVGLGQDATTTLPDERGPRAASDDAAAVSRFA